ncbi:MAG: 4-hydroxythreonine-4-phosphate dehydrogenase PdxA [Nitrospinae bacterium]|nr:4-hydroxythreonine-4-phosphate dehydrogenase PdxA [Nitrospinota bacterium]
MPVPPFDKDSSPKGGIALSPGDPAGIGPEVIVKAAAALPAALRRRLSVYGDARHFTALARRWAPELAVGAGGLRVINVLDFGMKRGEYGQVNRRCGAIAMRCLDAAMDAVTAGRHAALVTAPICKESVNLAGWKIPGHTEYLAARAGGIPVAMMLASEKLKVVVATTHIALRDVPRALDARKLTALILLVHRSVTAFGMKSPRIAVCGLNPHASDGGLFGDEERRIIAPAIAAARRRGVIVSGPHPADTMFTASARAKYDVALAMYHDQGLIPVKALSFGETVNVTLGLPYLRVSVDHGTAFDIAGKGIADARPMIHAVKTAARMLAGRW